MSDSVDERAAKLRELRLEALRVAKEYAHSIESNVVQDRIVEVAVLRALDVVMPHVNFPEDAPQGLPTPWVRIGEAWHRLLHKP